MAHKTTIETEIVDAFLKRSFNSEVSNLEFISGGEGSQAFSFKVGDSAYVIRVSHHNSDGFAKDEYAFKHFSSADIIIPEVIVIGKINNEYHYCISKKANGKILEEFSDTQRKYILPSVLRVLDDIHSVDIKETRGYGKWNREGEASHNSWHEILLSVDEYVWGTDNNPNYFETTFLDQGLWERGYTRMQELIVYCSEERYLLHGDAGSDNVLSDGNNVTAVIDWADSMYGDYLLDVSRLIFWSIDDEYSEMCRMHYANKGVVALNERLLCYQIFTALNSLSFYAYSKQEEKAHFSTKKLLELLSL